MFSRGDRGAAIGELRPTIGDRGAATGKLPLGERWFAGRRSPLPV
jgi:hypothetical protein